MAGRATALKAILVALVILSLTLGPNWSVAFIILLGLIASAVNRAVQMMKRRSILPLHAAGKMRGNPNPTLPVDADGRKRRKPKLSTSPSSSGINYEVFLSFKGTDTSDGFTDRLYRGLVDAGISVFRDYGNLRAGEEMKQELKEVIQQARISIAIFSKNYASSKICLNELVQMWECRKLHGQTVIPIFYNVSPLDVKHRAGDFGRSFGLHEMDRVDSNTIETWKEVLRRIGGLRGYIADLYRNGYEDELVRDVVALLAQVLKNDVQVAISELVGIDLHVQEMMRKLGVAYSNGQATELCEEEVRVVRLWGVPGVGKTTLAKVVFNYTHHLFDACSFLENIRSEGVQFSQQRLIADLKRKRAPLESSGEGTEEIASLCRNAKVLIVLDDVDEDEQVKALVGKLTWFGPGSRIIVTTNKRKVSNAFDVGAIDEHTVKPLGHDDALRLFCMHAFQGAAAQDVSQYFGLSMDIVKATGGLPSLIERHGSLLRDHKNLSIWKSTLDLLRQLPRDRQAAFQVNYAGGSELENSIEDNQLTSPIQSSSINQSPSVS